MSESRPIFDQPYLVTPDAVKRFQELIADLPSAQVVEVIQSLLQRPGQPMDVEYRYVYRGGKAPCICPIYRCFYMGKLVYLPVIAVTVEGIGTWGKLKKWLKKTSWPVVPTVLDRIETCAETETGAALPEQALSESASLESASSKPASSKSKEAE